MFREVRRVARAFFRPFSALLRRPPRADSPPTLPPPDFRFAAGDVSRSGYSHLLVLTLIFLGTRLPVFFHLDRVVISWRPSDNASMTLNFFRHGLNILHPEILWGGSGPGFVESEFPIVQFITAIFYRIFGVHDALGVILPLMSALGIVLVTYLLVTRLFEPALGFCAAAFVIISPSLTAYSETFFDDPTMVFFTILGVYAWLRWLETSRGWFYVLSAVSVAMAILIKLTALYIGLPLMYLTFAIYRWRFLRDVKHWLYAVLVLLPAVLWYSHSHTLYREYGNTFGILSGGELKTPTASILLSLRFYLSDVERIALYHLSPVVFVLFLFGLFLRQKSLLHYFFHFWAASVALYILASARGVVSGIHYLLPAIVPGASLASLGLFAIADNVHVRKIFGSPERGIFVGSVLAIVFVAGTLAADAVYVRRDFWGPWSPYQETEKKSGLMVGRVTRPGSLIIVANSLMDGKKPEESMTPPDIFYFADRRGWYRSFSWTTPEEIERLRSGGACYFVLSGNYVGAFKNACRTTYDYLEHRYGVVVEDSSGLVIDLCNQRDPAVGVNARLARVN